MLERPRIGIDWSMPIFAALALLLVILVVLPISWLAWYSLVDPKTGQLTLDNFRRW